MNIYHNKTIKYSNGCCFQQSIIIRFNRKIQWLTRRFLSWFLLNWTVKRSVGLLITLFTVHLLLNLSDMFVVQSLPINQSINSHSWFAYVWDFCFLVIRTKIRIRTEKWKYCFSQFPFNFSVHLPQQQQ